MYPPLENSALGARVEASAEDAAGSMDEALGALWPKRDGGDVVQRMRVTGRPWRWMIRWRRMVDGMFKDFVSSSSSVASDQSD